MNILITGAKGFVGKNLAAALKNIKDGKDKTHPEIIIDNLWLFDIDSERELLEAACKKADFVFNLAGVNRPENNDDFIKGNFGFAEELLKTLKKYNNACPVMLSSSIQATLIGRYNGDYGKSKKAGEDLFFEYAAETGAKVLVYRFPNLFGKWCRPNYNSAVATFCYNTANGLPIRIDNPDIELELVYIDDLVNEMLAALSGKENRCEFEGLNAVFKENGSFCFVPVTHRVNLGEIASLLDDFKNQPQLLLIPEIPENSFAKKLYSTYLSYLPYEKCSVLLKTNVDERGSFTELVKTKACGQISVNVTKPGVTKGMHWHNSKWEIFTVVSGEALIEQRKIGTNEVLEFKVSGDKPEAVYMLPGYTHSITNLSKTNDLITVMWANEQFDANRPDTFFEVVKND